MMTPTTIRSYQRAPSTARSANAARKPGVTSPAATASASAASNTFPLGRNTNGTSGMMARNKISATSSHVWSPRLRSVATIAINPAINTAIEPGITKNRSNTPAAPVSACTDAMSGAWAARVTDTSRPARPATNQNAVATCSSTHHSIAAILLSGDRLAARGEPFDQLRPPNVAGIGLHRRRDVLHASGERLIGEQPIHRTGQLRRLPVIRRQSDAEAGLVQALRIVVLIPEQRQPDHRQPEVEPLTGRVVAAVRDQQIALRQDRRLRQELVAVHVGPERHLILQRTHRHDRPVLGGRHRVDQPLHQPDVHAPERPERQIDDLPFARHLRRHVERRLPGPRPPPPPLEPAPPGPNGWFQPGPRRAEAALCGLSRRLGEQIEVEPG